MSVHHPPLKVIIIGGSVAGLTLAHSLDHAGIDYVLLEKHHDIQANIGGVIGLMPNGCRILDQLAIYHQLEPYLNPIGLSHTVFPDGSTISNPWPTWLLESFGYPVGILTRRQLLQVLSSTLPTPLAIRTGAKVVRIQVPDEPPGAPVSVQTEDGQEYTGDIVVGADGVHSIALAEMARLAGSPPDTTRDGITVEYQCILGISTPIPGLPANEQITCWYDDLSFLIFPCRGGAVSWTAIVKLGTCTLPQKPSSSSSSSLCGSQVDLTAWGEAVGHLQIWEEVRFRDLWDRTTTGVTATPLQEGLLQPPWTFGRLVCIGDSVSRMTPNLGQGANLAVESAAALASVLAGLKGLHQGQLSNTEIHEALHQYATVYRRRLGAIHALSHRVTRVQSRQKNLRPALTQHLHPLVGAVIFYIAADIVAAAVALDYLPLPRRSGGGQWVSPGRVIVRRAIGMILFFMLSLVTSYYITQTRGI